MNDNKINLKKEIFDYCKCQLEEKNNFLGEEIRETQHQANQFKGAMESRYDTFKEELQERKNTQIKQQNVVLNDLALLRRLQVIEMNSINTGAVVKATDENGSTMNYFFFTSIGTKAHTISNEKYIILNINTPLGNAFKGKKEGDIVKFRHKTFIINLVF